MKLYRNDIVITPKKTTGNATYPYHRHSGCEVYIFLSGNIRVYIDERCFLPPPESIIVFKPHEFHRIQSIDESVYERIILDLSPNFMKSLENEEQWLLSCFSKENDSSIITLDYSRMQDFLSLCRKIKRNSLSQEPACAVRKTSYTKIFLSVLNEVFEERKQHFHNSMPDTIVRIMKYVDKHLTDNIQFNQMASEFGIPLATLRKDFKAHIGLTLREYLLERKIVNAKYMLKNGASVTDACFSSGFNDYANFIRSFKKKEGISPGKYRKTSEEV